MSCTVKHDIINIIRAADFIPEGKREKLINKVMEAFGMYKEPIASMLWVPLDKILPNSYNPNKMAVPEKRLLLRSLLLHGITSPLVVSPEREGKYPLIDGYHRWNIIKQSKELKNRLDHKVPVVILALSNNEGMVATIRHNRARGRHQIAEISEVVKTLSANGWSPQRIMDELGMDADEVLRLKQFQGLGELFKDGDYSASWK